jgi:PmbA protein
MMEELLQIAQKKGCKAEVFFSEGYSDIVSFEDSKLKNIDSKILSGISLRIIKDNKLGFAYTRNLLNKEELVNNALKSLKGGVDGFFEFPLTQNLKNLDTYSPDIEDISNNLLVEECKRLCDTILHKISCQINVTAQKTVNSLRLINTSGTELSVISSSYALTTELVYPYSSASLYRVIAGKSFIKAGDEYINFLTENYGHSLKEVKANSGRMKVIFLPETLYVLMWRLQTAASSNSLYQNISPLAGRIGEKVFDEKFTVFNDPLNDSIPGARAFDDEGVQCRQFPIVEKGIFRNFYYDLYFAERLKTDSTGNGFRASVSSKPSPALRHIYIVPGDKSFSDLIQSIDKGIIVGGALGAHSGNIPNGDFSIGISPAIYVENGNVVGHIKDAMAAGNIYETLTNIIDVENKTYISHGGNCPSILFNEVNVIIK